jgi:hypothetical protein
VQSFIGRIVEKKDKNILKVKESKREINNILNTDKIQSKKALHIESDVEKVEKKIEILYNEINFTKAKLK